MNTQEAIKTLVEIRAMYFHPCPDNVRHQEVALTHAIEHMKRSQEKKQSDVIWFKNESVDDPLLTEFISNTDFDYFKKAGRDKNGRYNIFLVKDDESIAAICSNSQKLHVHALKLLTELPSEYLKHSEG